MHSPESERSRRRGQAIRLLRNLIENALAIGSGHRGLLRHGCYSRPHGQGTDSAVSFGDLYFVEALCWLLMPDLFLPEDKPFPP